MVTFATAQIRITHTLNCLLIAALTLVATIHSEAFAQSGGPQGDSLTASGPVGDALENRVELLWSTATPPAANDRFTIKRDGVLLATVARTISPWLYVDNATTPGDTLKYCVYVLASGGSETLVDCDDGGRVIARPTEFRASKGVHEDRVELTWKQWSEIEAGHNIYRSAGNALNMDGTDDYVSTAGLTQLQGSFTFEFWAMRASTGTEDFVINLETNPNGAPQDVDVEAGFTSNDRFQMAFGTNVLTTSATYLDAGWHHWAVVYDAPAGRRYIFRNGELAATDAASMVSNPTGDLEFGRRRTTGSTNTRGHFHGRLDEVKYWNAALTPDQVRNAMNSLVRRDAADLVGYWPMDVQTGLAGPDVVGPRVLTLRNMAANSWVASGAPERYVQIGKDLQLYADNTAAAGFQSYTYGVAAFEDVNLDGRYTAGIDFESERRSDTGWRGRLAAPANVAATDGQFLDRVRITWVDMSLTEQGYRVYRDGGLVATLAAGAQSYDDLSATSQHNYCVASFGPGAESIQVCDTGRAGGLLAPDGVVASNGTFDDRVRITWMDVSDAEQGFEIFRNGVQIAAVDANATEYNDPSAAQHVEYDYCVRAFSKSDPLNPSYSAQTCAPDKGLRAIILDPTDLEASNNAFEDRVELTWKNPSTTAMLFLVYRESDLIEVLDFNTTKTLDRQIASDTDVEYCVIAATVVAPTPTASVQGQIAQVLQSIKYRDTISLASGGVATSAEAKLAAVSEAVGFSISGGAAAADTSGYVESGAICETGSRSILPPTAVAATDNEFESHVQITWEDNSSVERGYLIFRAVGQGTPVRIDSLSPGRTTYGDYKGVPGQQYRYSVSAVDSFGVSVSGADLGTRTLKPPTQLSVSDGISETEIKLAWKDNSSAERGYRIFRKKSGDADSTVTGSTGKNEPAFVDTNFGGALGVEYSYFVMAYDSFGVSLAATGKGKTALNAPANVNASKVYADSIVVVWVDRSSVEDSMVVTRRLLGPGASIVPDTLARLAKNSTRLIDKPAGPDSNKDYEYCVLTEIGPKGAKVASTATCSVGRLFTGAIAGGGGGGGTASGGAIRIDGGQLTSNSDGALRFGASVAMSAARLALIGVPGADPNGKARLDSVTSSNEWTTRTTFDPATGNSFNEFGHAVDIHGSYAVVGNPAQDEDNLGAFGVWRRSGGTWTPRTSVADSANTGFSVANSDSFVVVGDNRRGGGRGRAIVCNVEANSTCDKAVKLDSVLIDAGEPLAANSRFGHAVDVTRVTNGSDDSLYVIVGAPGVRKAYVFECDLGSTGRCTTKADWDFARELVNTFTPAGTSRYGESVAVDGTVAVVGASGVKGIIVYERTELHQWVEQDRRRMNSADEFGFAVDVKDARILVGAPAESQSGYNESGAVYAFTWSNELSDSPVRYDARADGTLAAGARFGASVALGPDLYVVGAPGDVGGGAVYAIPFGFEPPDDPVLPPTVDLNAPTDARASDGTAPDRIQIRWKDMADNEDGQFIYRSIEGGGFEQLAEVAANIEFYDDFSAAPGEAYRYCVVAFGLSSSGIVESDRACDVGWRPANGAISGRVATREGSGSDGVQVCVMPDPNKSLLLDGAAGYLEAPIIRDAENITPLDVERNFTVEAWIRPHAVNGTRAILSREGSYTLYVKDGDFHLTVVETDGGKPDFKAGATLAAGSWYHVAAVRGGDNSVTFFLNGANIKRETSQLLVEKAGRDTLTIGRLADGTGIFMGEIDEVRIWNVAREGAQIARSMSAALTGKEEGLIGYWPLDQGLRLIAPDVTASANHANLIGGVYLTDQGADVNVCAVTGVDGNYTLSRIPYGLSTEFDLIPSRSGRMFSPSFKKITLSRDSPVANEVFFNDVTAYTVAGIAVFEDVVGEDTLTCPVGDVTIHVDKGSVASDSNVRMKTSADGSFSLSVDPSTSASDLWYVIPQYAHPQDGQLVHLFDPPHVGIAVLSDTFDVQFKDQQRHTLSGHYSGGDPSTCGMDIGRAAIRIYTENGCYDRTDTLDSAIDFGAFSIDLPPQAYLVEVIPLEDAEEDVHAFFKELGAIEVDLTRGDVERNLIYRAPLELLVEGLEPIADSCPTGISVSDGEGGVLRTLPPVATIAEYGFAPLKIKVLENYGDQSCEVGEGTVTIFDAISDRVDVDSTMTLEDGLVEYTVFGASPNTFAGARIQGVDRSYQKPITVVAEVEGRPALMQTHWAVVEGFRERPATFVSAVTDKIPFLILHDPPGSDSYAFIEKGTSKCTRVTHMGLFGGGAGGWLDAALGFKTGVGFSFGAHSDVEVGGGLLIQTRQFFGGDTQFTNGSNYEICTTTTETWTTSSDPGWVGEDVFVGAALNFIFALADKVEVGPGECELSLSEVIATDLNAVDPFETVYAYGKSHIEMSLIPELDRLVRLGGDATIIGQIDNKPETVRLKQAIQNWQNHLALAETETERGLTQNKKNRSFSGGTEFTYAESRDSTWITSFESSRFYFDSENAIGGVISAGYDNTFGFAFEFHAESYFEQEKTEGDSEAVGYTLADNDGGDFVSVDVGKDPSYGTFVFNTVSGRTSNPCEANTQCRDNPIIAVDPPVRHNVDPDDAASFELTLINASESNERRRYSLVAPPESNPGNLSLTAVGGWLSSPIEFLLEPGKALTVNLDVFAGPSVFSYENVGVMLYPTDELAIWGGEPRLPFERSDTAFFSVHFNTSGGNVQASMMSEGWNWVSINREGGELATVLNRVTARQGDVIRSQRAESRYDSTNGWTGSLTRLVPGEGYRLRLKEPSILRVEGQAIEATSPTKLAPGWSWIGYMPTKRLPVAEALASLNNRVIDGDLVVGQDGFAQYVKNVGWVGTLRDMAPGDAYAIYLDGGGELLYPKAPDQVTPREPVVREITTQGPDWSLSPADFDASMTVVAEVQLDGTTLPQTTSKIAVLNGEDIRGIGEVHFVETLQTYLTFIQIYGGVDETLPLTVHVYDGERDLLYEDVATITYAAQTRLGQPSSPVMIELSNAGQAPELLDLPVEFSLHANFPNPFNDYTIIGYDLPEASNVRLVVYDMLGRRVATLVDDEKPAGHHKAVFDGRPVASGMYVYRMQIGESKYLGKMVLVK